MDPFMLPPEQETKHWSQYHQPSKGDWVTYRKVVDALKEAEERIQALTSAGVHRALDANLEHLAVLLKDAIIFSPERYELRD